MEARYGCPTGGVRSSCPHAAKLASARGFTFTTSGILLPRCFQAGYPPKMLQEIMGHASITTTLDLYGHLYPGDMDRYADRLDSAAEEAGKAKTRPGDDKGEQATG
jgi:hypothetical protein